MSDMSITITHIGSGKYSDVFSLNYDRIQIAMKVSYYEEKIIEKFAKFVSKHEFQKAIETKNEDAISISNKFSKLVRELDIPHFVIIYDAVDVKFFITRLLKNFDGGVSSRLTKLTENQLKYNNVVFMDKYDSDMTSFLSHHKHDNILKKLIFQVMFAVCAAQKALQGWRHNDLSTNNVLVKKSTSKTYTYSIGTTSYCFETNIDIAIIDFDFVNVPGVLNNERVTGGGYGVSSKKNVSYDTHFFMKSVSRCMYKNKQHPECMETMNFLKDLNLKRTDRQTDEIISLDPRNIIKHKFFDSLKQNAPITRWKI